MRLLLDEGFPTPPGFEPRTIDATVEVTALRVFDRALVGAQTPDWYLYLRAHEGQFDALVTRDWHQSEQPEEMFALTKTRLSIITWKKPLNDPIREWGQLLAYLPEIRRMIESHGPSILFLPSPRLDRGSITKAAEAIGQLASDLGISNRQVRSQASQVIAAGLRARGEPERFTSILGGNPS